MKKFLVALGLGLSVAAILPSSPGGLGVTAPSLASR